MKLKTKIGIGILFFLAISCIYTGISSGKEHISLIPIGLAIGIFAFLFLKRKRAETEEMELEQEQEQELLVQSHASNQPQPQRYAQLVAPDEDDEEEEESTFSIKGINYANLDDSYLGDHDGYIKAVTDNPKDPYAIAVYVGRKRVGWLPAGNSKLHADLLSMGGKAKVDIQILKGYDDYDNHPFYYGKAVIPR